jgi:hypothetical protein
VGILLLIGVLAYFLLQWLSIPGLNRQIKRLKAEVGTANRLDELNDELNVTNQEFLERIDDLTVQNEEFAWLNGNLNATAKSIDFKRRSPCWYSQEQLHQCALQYQALELNEFVQKNKKLGN